MLFLLGGLALLFGLSQTSAGETIIQNVEDAVQPYLDSWTRFDALYQYYADKNFIDWQKVKAFAMNESSNGTAKSVVNGINNPTDIEASKSYDGKSWGIMQMIIPTAKSLDPNADAVKLNNPEYSIALGCEYIAELEDMFSRADPRFQEWVVKSYNQGPGNTRKEMSGKGGGYANEYWERWQRNYQKVLES